MLSEKDLKISMRKVTAAWYEGRVFKHPETGNMVKFWALPKDERNRLNQMVKKKQIEESQPSIPGGTPVSPSKRPKQIRPKVLKRRKEIEEPKKKPEEEKKIKYPTGLKEGDIIKKKWCDEISKYLQKRDIEIDLWKVSGQLAEKGDVKHILEILDDVLKDKPDLYNNVFRALGQIPRMEREDKEVKEKAKEHIEKEKIKEKPIEERPGRTRDFKQMGLEKIKDINTVEAARNILRGRGVDWAGEHPVKDKEGSIAEIHFVDKDLKGFGYWLIKNKEFVLNNKMIDPEKLQPVAPKKDVELKPKKEPEKPKEYMKDFMEQVKAVIPAGKKPETWHEAKDAKRIYDIIEKAKGDSDKEGRLGIAQANRIGGAFKAFRRYNAAKAAGNKHLAFIFRERFESLARAGIFEPGKIKRPAKPVKPRKPKDVEVSEMPKFDNPIFNTERDKKMKTMKIVAVEYHGGGINDSYKIRFDDKTSGCFKPGKGMGYGTPKHEVYASGLNRFLGYKELVPPTVIRTVPKKGVGSVQQWRDSIMFGSKAKNDFFSYREAKVPAEELAQSWMLDFLMVNTDRHSTNWLMDKNVGKDGKRHMHLIDNGLCLTKARSFVINYWSLKDEDKPKFEKLVKNLEKIEPHEFQRAFGKVLNEKEIKHMMRARDIIIKKRDPHLIKREIENLQFHWGGGE